MAKGKGRGSVIGIITIFIALLVGVVLLGPFADSQNDAYNQTGLGTNITGGAHSIVGLLTLFFALVVFVAVVKWGMGGG